MEYFTGQRFDANFWKMENFIFGIMFRIFQSKNSSAQGEPSAGESPRLIAHTKSSATTQGIRWTNKHLRVEKILLLIVWNGIGLGDAWDRSSSLRWWHGAPVVRTKMGWTEITRSTSLFGKATGPTESMILGGLSICGWNSSFRSGFQFRQGFSFVLSTEWDRKSLNLISNERFKLLPILTSRVWRSPNSKAIIISKVRYVTSIARSTVLKFTPSETFKSFPSKAKPAERL
jgi:hypothetical protein